MGNERTATFTSVVRKVGGSSVITIPIASMKALDIEPKDYVSIMMVKVDIPFASRPKKKEEEKDRLQMVYEL